MKIVINFSPSCRSKPILFVFKTQMKILLIKDIKNEKAISVLPLKVHATQPLMFQKVHKDIVNVIYINQAV